jgi:hypothetical protein
MNQITFVENGVAVDKTTEASAVFEEQELMRAWTLKFMLDNKNEKIKHIKPDAVFVIDGQQFEIEDFDQESGNENTTKVVANHVSYDLNSYIVPPMYTNLGTPAELLNKLLTDAEASEKFTTGNTPDIGELAFNLGNEQEVSLRSALLGLQSIGLEVEFDVKMLREDFNSDAPLIKVYNYILPTNCRYEDKGDIKFTLTTISNLLMSLKPDELNLQILKLKKDIDILSSNARLISSEDEVKSLSAYFKKDLFHSEIKELSARLKLQSFAISMAKDFEKLLVSSS